MPIFADSRENSVVIAKFIERWRKEVGLIMPNTHICTYPKIW